MSRGGLSAAVLVSSVSLTALCSSPALAQSYWQGNVSGDWNNILNWSDLLVPSAATTVVIADGSNYSATISSYAATANILRVGGFVGSSLLQVNLGGSLVASSTQIGNDALEVGSVGVDGVGATWNSQFLDVGRYGTGTFTLSGGASGTSEIAYSGVFSGSSGSVTVTDAGTTWTNTNGHIIGSSGTGSFQVLNGAAATDRSANLGHNATGNGTATISGAGSTWTIQGALTAGVSGAGTVIANSGTAVSATGNAIFGQSATANGTLSLSGAGSTLTTGGYTVLGHFGAGDAVIGSGAVVSTKQGIMGWEASGVGTLRVTGNAQWLGTSYLMVGNLGTAEATIDNGGLVRIDNGAGRISIANGAGSRGTLNIGAAEGSAAQAAGILDVAEIRFGSGTGRLVFNHTNANLAIGAAITGNGTVVQKAGTTRLTGANTYTGGTTLSGGSLSVSQDSNLGSASGGLTFNGGTLLATNSFASSRDVQLQSGNGTLNVDSSITLTLSGPVSGSGKLIKDGFGTLRMTGAGTYTGGTRIDQGVLRAEANGALGSGPVLVNGGLLAFTNAGAGNLSITTTNAGSVSFEGTADAGSANFVTEGGGPSNRSGVTFYSGTSAGSATFVNKAYGSVTFGSGSTAGNAVITNEAGGTAYFTGSSKADTGTVINKAGGNLDISAQNGHLVLGTLIGDGNVFLGAADLVLGSNGRDSTVGGGFFDGGYAGGSGGGLVKVGSGTLRLTGESTYTGLTEVQAGTLRVDGSLASDVVISNGATLSGIGEVGGIGVNGGGTVAPGNSIGTLSAAGDVGFARGSIYQVEVNAAGQSDRIESAGKAILLGGTVQVLAENGSYEPSTQYTILRAQKGVTGRFSDVTSNLAFLSPFLGYGTDSVTLTLARASDGSNAFSSVATSANQFNTATALDALGGNNRLFQAVIGQSAAGARQAFDALSGEVHASATGSASRQAWLVQNSLLTRLREPLSAPSLPRFVQGTYTAAYAADTPGRASPVAVTPRHDPLRFALWGEGYGSWGKTSATSNAAALDASTGGFILGGEVRLGAASLLGLAGGFGRTSFDVDARLSSGSTQTTFGALYGATSWGALSLRGGLSYGHHDTDSRRTVLFPGFSDAVSASYGGWTALAFGEAGYRIDWGRAMVEPFAGLSVQRLHTDAFFEEGGAAALTGYARDYDLGITTLGVRAEARLGEDVPLIVKGLLGWRHAFGDVEPNALMAFAGGASPFTVAGVPVDRDALVAEAGLDWQFSRDMTLGVVYSGQIGVQAREHTLKGSFNWRF